jgi:hypothetical protein
MTERHWRYRDPEQAKKISIDGFEWVIIPEEDKQVVRDNILEAMFKCQETKIIKQYVACITNIARFDHPDKWPNLVPQIVEYLHNKESNKAVMTGLLSLKGLVKKYEYEMEKEREPLSNVVASTFHILGGLVDQLLQNDDDLSLEIIYIICKIFYFAN